MTNDPHLPQQVAIDAYGKGGFRFGDMSQVRIRHLMSHSAGFRAATWPWGGDQPWHPFEPTKWEQLVAMMPYTNLEFAPGSKYSYSNPGVIFLGRWIGFTT